MDTQEKISALEAVIQQLEDITNSYGALVEKMARAQMDIDEVDDIINISDTMETPFKNASDDHQALSGLVDDINMKVNQLRQEES